MNKKRVFLTQILMTGIMAAAMSGIMSLIALGASPEWLAIWGKQFLIAWPIAFVVTMAAWPLANRLASLLMRDASAP